MISWLRNNEQRFSAPLLNIQRYRTLARYAIEALLILKVSTPGFSRTMPQITCSTNFWPNCLLNGAPRSKRQVNRAEKCIVQQAWF
jgi:hypothetical protein